MNPSMIMLYTIDAVMIIGCALLFIAVADLHDISCRQLHGALDLYERMIDEVVVEIDRFAVDDDVSDPVYSGLVSTVAAITDPANAALVREATGEGATIAKLPSGGSAAIFDASLEELAHDPELRTRYADVIMKSVRAAMLWDLAHRGSGQPFLKIPTWANDPWRERDIIESSRYDDSLLRGILSRLRVAEASLIPLRHAY